MNDIVIIPGTHKKNGASNRVAQRLAQLSAEHLSENTTEILSLADVPFWDEGMWGNPELADKWSVWKPIAERLRRADGLIVISPEYAGMVPPRLSNFMLLCSGAEIGHKPALPVSVSASRGGAYPITQLRSYAYKNNHVCWLPDHLIVRNVDAGGEAGLLSQDEFEGKFAVYCLKLLDSYATALKTVREGGLVDFKTYPYGM